MENFIEGVPPTRSKSKFNLSRLLKPRTPNVDSNPSAIPIPTVPSAKLPLKRSQDDELPPFSPRRSTKGRSSSQALAIPSVLVQSPTPKSGRGLREAGAEGPASPTPVRTLGRSSSLGHTSMDERKPSRIPQLEERRTVATRTTPPSATSSRFSPSIEGVLELARETDEEMEEEEELRRRERRRGKQRANSVETTSTTSSGHASSLLHSSRPSTANSSQQSHQCQTASYIRATTYPHAPSSAISTSSISHPFKPPRVKRPSVSSNLTSSSRHSLILPNPLSHPLAARSASSRRGSRSPASSQPSPSFLSSDYYNDADLQRTVRNVHIQKPRRKLQVDASSPIPTSLSGIPRSHSTSPRSATSPFSNDPHSASGDQTAFSRSPSSLSSSLPPSASPGLRKQASRSLTSLRLKVFSKSVNSSPASMETRSVLSSSTRSNRSVATTASFSAGGTDDEMRRSTKSEGRAESRSVGRKMKSYLPNVVFYGGQPWLVWPNADGSRPGMRAGEDEVERVTTGRYGKEDELREVEEASAYIPGAWK